MLLELFLEFWEIALQYGPEIIVLGTIYVVYWTTSGALTWAEMRKQ